MLGIGCGAGWFSNAIANNYKRQVLGLDFNPRVIERARAVAAKLDLESQVLYSGQF